MAQAISATMIAAPAATTASANAHPQAFSEVRDPDTIARPRFSPAAAPPCAGRLIHPRPGHAPIPWR